MIYNLKPNKLQEEFLNVGQPLQLISGFIQKKPKPSYFSNQSHQQTVISHHRFRLAVLIFRRFDPLFHGLQHKACLLKKTITKLIGIFGNLHRLEFAEIENLKRPTPTYLIFI